MEYIQPVMGTGYLAGSIAPGQTQYVASMALAPIPCTATLVSTAGGRLIELSTDGGTNFFTPTLDANTANMINVAIKAPVSNVRFTGATADNWSIR